MRIVPRTEAPIRFQKDSRPQAGNYGRTDSKAEPLLGPNPEPSASVANRVTAGETALQPLQHLAVGATWDLAYADRAEWKASR